MVSPALAPGRSRTKTWVVFLLVLLGLVGVGRVAMETWLDRKAPLMLPELGARTTKAQPLLLIVIDGLREESAFAERDAPMPWFQEFASKGAHGIGVAGEPTLTAPCVRALITGRRPDLMTGFRNFNARPVGGSLVEYLVRRGARPAHGGDAAIFQFCRPYFTRPGDVLQFPDQGPTDQGESDAKAVPFVIDRIAAGATLATLHVTGPDHAGHKYGAVGREYWQACRTVDEQLQLVTEAWLARHPNSHVFIAADHGVSAMGTHGGGERSARRAPFLLVGPDVRPGRYELDQCSLVPTIAMLLGLPQPPLADAPPAPQLTTLSKEITDAALKAYVQARLMVAADLRGDPVEVKRARSTVAELGNPDQKALMSLAKEVNEEINPNSTGHATIALVLAALWLALLVHMLGVARLRDPWGLGAVILLVVAFFLSFDPFPHTLPVSPVVSAALALLGCASCWYALETRRFRGGGFTLACLLAVLVLTAGGLTWQQAFDKPGFEAPPVGVSMLVVGGLAGLLVLTIRPRRSFGPVFARGAVSPGLIAAFGGSVLGFLLTLRPFIDPFLHLMIVYAILGALCVYAFVAAPGGRRAPRRLRYAVLALGLVLFVGTRILEGLISDGATWVSYTPMRDTLWWLAGVLLVPLVLWISLERELPTGRDLFWLLLATLSVLSAFAARAMTEAPPSLTLGSNALGLVAVVGSLFMQRGPARLAVRLLAALGMARLLSQYDAEFLVFGGVTLGAALMARFDAPTSRVRLAWLAVALVAIRTAIFHAMGFVESFSTLDVGQAFQGLGQAEDLSFDAAGGVVITWQVVVAGIRLSLRMALPWLVILSALSRSFERTPGAGPALFRTLLVDLAVTYAARGAAIVTALWAWWRQSWWMTHAYTVYAFGAGDVLLILGCALVAGGFAGEPRSRPQSTDEGFPAAPAPAKMGA